MIPKPKLNRAFRLSRLFTKLADELKNLDVLLEGNVLRAVEEIRTGYVDGLIRANKFLQELNIVRFIASGTVGDTWLLDNGTVLKIFDNNIKNELKKYKSISDMLFSEDPKDRANASSEIMIHGYGLLNELDDFRDTPAPPKSKFLPDKFRRWDERSGLEPIFLPAYVIIEFVETMESRLGHSAAQGLRPDLLPESILKRGGFPDWFMQAYKIEKSIQEDPQKYTTPFITEMYVEAVISRLTLKAIKDHYNMKRKDFPMLTNPMDLLDKGIAASFGYEDQSIVDIWTDDFMRDIGYGLYDFLFSKDDLQTAKELLGLDEDWVRSLTRLTLDKLAKGQGDVHFGNLGFRIIDERPLIYFDA